MLALARCGTCAVAALLAVAALPFLIGGTIVALSLHSAEELVNRTSVWALLAVSGALLACAWAASCVACSRAPRGCSRAVALLGTAAAFLLACSANVLTGPGHNLLLQSPVNETLDEAGAAAVFAGAFAKASFAELYASCDPVAYPTDAVNSVCSQKAPEGEDFCAHNAA